MYRDFDKDVLNDLKKLETQIQEELDKDEIDREKLLKLRMQKRYRGLDLNRGIAINNYRAGIPY